MSINTVSRAHLEPLAHYAIETENAVSRLRDAIADKYTTQQLLAIHFSDIVTDESIKSSIVYIINVMDPIPQTTRLVAIEKTLYDARRLAGRYRERLAAF